MTALQIARFEGYKDVVAALEAAARAAVVKPSAAHCVAAAAGELAQAESVRTAHATLPLDRTSNEPKRKKPKRG
jgi:hypothetical protein